MRAWINAPSLIVMSLGFALATTACEEGTLVQDEDASEASADETDDDESDADDREDDESDDDDDWDDDDREDDESDDDDDDEPEEDDGDEDWDDDEDWEAIDECFEQFEVCLDRGERPNRCERRLEVCLSEASDVTWEDEDEGSECDTLFGECLALGLGFDTCTEVYAVCEDNEASSRP